MKNFYEMMQIIAKQKFNEEEHDSHKDALAMGYRSIEDAEKDNWGIRSASQNKTKDFEELEPDHNNISDENLSYQRLIHGVADLRRLIDNGMVYSLDNINKIEDPTSRKVKMSFRFATAGMGIDRSLHNILKKWAIPTLKRELKWNAPQNEGREVVLARTLLVAEKLLADLNKGEYANKEPWDDVKIIAEVLGEQAKLHQERLDQISPPYKPYIPTSYKSQWD